MYSSGIDGIGRTGSELSSNDDDNELNHDPQYNATDESDSFVGKHYSSSRKTNKLHSATMMMFISDESDIDVGAIVTKWTMPASANRNDRTLSLMMTLTPMIVQIATATWCSHQ
jgi:hypothetical protein